MDNAGGDEREHRHRGDGQGTVAEHHR
jgi:hypothetical protein